MSSSSPTVCHDQALSQFPLVLQPLRKYPQPPSPKSSPSESLSDWGKDTFDRQTGRLECFLVLPALVIAILFAASGTLLSLYFSIWRGVPRPAGFMPSQPAFYVSDGGSGNASLLGLTITTVIVSINFLWNILEDSPSTQTHAMWISSLWLVAIAAYCVAGSWIAYQQHSREDGVHSPTPLQFVIMLVLLNFRLTIHRYGFILKLLSTPSVGSIYHSGRYILDYRRRVPISPVLCLAFCLVTLIVAENYLIRYRFHMHMPVNRMLIHYLSLADIYLHATSSMVSVNTTDLLHEPKDFGVAFNESLCHPLQSGNGNECSVFAQTDWASADSIFVRRALQIASNSSPFSVSVTTLGNASDLAVVIPSSTDPSLSFEAPSFGVRAQCRNLTPLCLTDSPSIYNCTSAGYPQLPVNTTSDTFGTRIALDPGSASDSHSQTVLLQMVWPFSVTHLPNTVVASLNSSRLGAWSACEMAFYNLTLRHVAGQYEVVGEPTFSGATFAKLMSTPLVSPVLSFQLISNLQVGFFPPC